MRHQSIEAINRNLQSSISWKYDKSQPHSAGNLGLNLERHPSRLINDDRAHHERRVSFWRSWQGRPQIALPVCNPYSPGRMWWLQSWYLPMYPSQVLRQIYSSKILLQGELLMAASPKQQRITKVNSGTCSIRSFTDLQNPPACLNLGMARSISPRNWNDTEAI